MRLQGCGAERLTGLRAAQVHHMPAAAVLAKIMVETHHAVHFGDRQVQFPRDQRHGILGDEAQLFLHRVQNRQQGAGQGFQSRAGILDRLALRGAQRRHGFGLERNHPPRRRGWSWEPRDRCDRNENHGLIYYADSTPSTPWVAHISSPKATPFASPEASSRPCFRPGNSIQRRRAALTCRCAARATRWFPAHRGAGTGPCLYTKRHWQPARRASRIGSRRRSAMRSVGRHWNPVPGPAASSAAAPACCSRRSGCRRNGPPERRRRFPRPRCPRRRCRQADAVEQLAEIMVEAREPRYVAPTRRDQIGRIWAPVFINGRGPFRLVLDTGASSSGVTAMVALALGIPTDQSPHVMLRGVTGSATVPTIRVDSLSVGDLSVDSPLLPIVPDAMGGAQGILGSEGLTNKRIFIDFQPRQNLHHASRAASARSVDFISVPFRSIRGQLIVVDAIVGRRAHQGHHRHGRPNDHRQSGAAPGAGAAQFRLSRQTRSNQSARPWPSRTAN